MPWQVSNAFQSWQMAVFWVLIVEVLPQAKSGSPQWSSGWGFPLGSQGFGSGIPAVERRGQFFNCFILLPAPWLDFRMFHDVSRSNKIARWDASWATSLFGITWSSWVPQILGACPLEMGHDSCSTTYPYGPLQLGSKFFPIYSKFWFSVVACGLQDANQYTYLFLW